ncbi:MAG: hypothetical protein FWG02_06610 [Holophagaceae bacterium]|nr:hypothetical protein [Holophagaceae bacterium]
MFISLAFILLQATQTQATVPQGDELRIVAVEQSGKPPYQPEGRIYRLAGSSLSKIKPGEILIIKRPKEERNIGSLRVLAVQKDSATASLEVRGDTFPLKGDLAYPLASLDIPDISMGTAKPLKDSISFPLTPLTLPPINQFDSDNSSNSKNATTTTNANSPNNNTPSGQSKNVPTSSRNVANPPVAEPLTTTALQPPSSPRPLEEIIAEAKATSDNSANADGITNNTPALPVIVDQRAFYFLAGSSELSPRGREKLQEWVNEWGKSNVSYFLAVPDKQIKLQKLLVERLAVLQRELGRLGIASVGFKTDTRNLTEPFDTIYVGIEK